MIDLLNHIHTCIIKLGIGLLGDLSTSLWSGVRFTIFWRSTRYKKTNFVQFI